MKKDILMLTTSELLFSVAEASILIFGLIFFYQKFNSVLLAAAPFALLHFVQAFFEPFLGKFVFKIGLKTSWFIGSIFYIAMSLVIVFMNGKYTFEALVLWGFLYGIANIFHYIPIIYILGTSSKHSARGRLFSLRRIIFIISGVLTPVIAGFVSQQFKFDGLIVMCILFYVLSNIPILNMGSVETSKPKQLLKTLSTMRGKKIFLYNISEVFNNNMGDFWPIFVFIILAGSFSEVGIFFALVTLITVIVTYFTGKALDNKSRPKMYFAASVSTFITWMLRAASFNYITVLIADTLYKINANFKTQISEVIAYDLMNDHVNTARASVIILNETIVNYVIGFLLFAGAMCITVFGFQTSFIIFGILGFVFAQIMRRYLKD